MYERRRLHFTELKELHTQIKRVWRSVVNMESLRKAIKQFRPRLQAIVDNEGAPIEAYYG